VAAQSTVTKNDYFPRTAQMKSPFQKYLEGIGTIPFWGISPALDLQDGGRGRPICPAKPLSIALVGCGDIRHALLTLSRIKRWPERDITMVFIDNEPEIMARHLLLLQIVFDPTLGARECSEVFLEVYGNCRLRPKTSEYVCAKAGQLIDLVTNCTGYLSQLVDLSWLKFKDRDDLVDLFQSWRSPKTTFDIVEYRDKRLRSYYEERYDFRSNLCEWDLHMKIRDFHNGSIIHPAWWRRFRLFGLAFEFRDVQYSEPNRTLCGTTEGREKGRSVLRRGFWGDIVHSPYFAFSTRSEDSSMFEKRSDQHTKTPVQVAEHNVFAMLHEIVYGRPFVRAAVPTAPSIESDAFSEAAAAASAAAAEVVDDSTFTRAEDEPPRAIPARCKIHFVRGPLSVCYGKKRFNRLFNRAVFSNSQVQCFKSPLNELLQDSASITAEGARYMLDISKEHQQAFDAKLRDLAVASSWKVDVCLDLGEPFLSFRFDRAEDSSMPAVALSSLADAAATAIIDSEMVNSADSGPNLLETMSGLRLAASSGDKDQ
jgi:dynein assembly factor 3